MTDPRLARQIRIALGNLNSTYKIFKKSMCYITHRLEGDRKGLARCRTCRPSSNPVPIGRLVKGGKR